MTLSRQFDFTEHTRCASRVKKGIEAVKGYLTSLAAWVGGDLAEDGVDLSVVLHWLVGKGGDYLERVDRDFSAEVRRKRIKFGLQAQ